MEVIEERKSIIYNSFPSFICKDVKDLVWIYVEGDLPLYKKWSEMMFDKILNRKGRLKLYDRNRTINTMDYTLYDELGPTLGEFLDEPTKALLILLIIVVFKRLR